MSLFSPLGVASAGGIVAIVVLVGLVTWRWSRHHRARSRPASPEDLIEQVERLPTYAMNFHGTEFGGLVERDKVLALLGVSRTDADQRRRTLRSIAAQDYHRQSRHDQE